MHNEVEVPKQVKEFIDKQREQLMDKLQIILEGQRHACEYPSQSLVNGSLLIQILLFKQ
ncbi:hypothetical protein EGEOBHOM_00067 [Enterococcus phage vB_OCPT_Car]|uniref:Uncharacterized protein n=1 Tax=Enterococcus phage vB_OCPT_Car TaxID=2922319 RepID=A0A9E7DU27_9CAUD|nr:hypothetical protein EGEOBHOM_00067 [Enterococcus phage vB_OCPT_Car]